MGKKQNIKEVSKPEFRVPERNILILESSGRNEDRKVVKIREPTFKAEEKSEEEQIKKTFTHIADENRRKIINEITTLPEEEKEGPEILDSNPNDRRKAPIIDEITDEGVINPPPEEKVEITDFNNIVLTEKKKKVEITEVTLKEVKSDFDDIRDDIKEINNDLEYQQNQIDLVRSFIPVGTIIPYPSSYPPVGYLLCDGSSLSKTIYWQLYSIIGTTYGEDDPDSFCLPDLRGRVIFGNDNDAFSFANIGGNSTVTLTNNNLPSHSHTGTVDSNGAHTHTGTTDSNGSHSHDITDLGHQHALINAVDDNNGSNNPGQYPAGDAVSNAVFGGPTSSATTGISINANGAHTHTFTTASNGAHVHTFTTNNTGLGNAFSILNPYLVLSYIIRHGVNEFDIPTLNITSKGLTGDQGLTVGGEVTKDMAYDDYTEEFDPNDYYPEFFPDMAPLIDENIVAGDKDISDKNQASYWDDLGNDVFDDWGYFYIYDVDSGKYYFPLFSPLNQDDEVLTKQIFHAFGRVFTITHGFVAQGLFKFDISVEDNRPFRFGAYGNMGSDGSEKTAPLLKRHIVDGKDVPLCYHFHSEEGDTEEVLYSYFIPKLISENNTRTYSVFYDEDDMSMMSKEVTKGLLVYFSKKNDVKDWVINDLA
jgi:microcystin-dependent protein